MEEKHDYYFPEKDLEDHPKAISLAQMQVMMTQMKDSICRIKSKEGYGTGFFCLIPNPSKFKLLPVLITSNSVLNEKDIEENQIIEFSLNNDRIKKTIIIDNLRKTYTSKEYDATFIEVKEIDNLNISSFLEIDYELYEEIPNEEYKQKSIYFLDYPNSDEAIFSVGVIKCVEDDNYTLNHLCCSELGSSGGPLLNLSNFKVIGIHKGEKKTENMNIGTLIKAPIDEFNKRDKKQGEDP